MNQISNRLSVISSFYQVYVHIFCSGQCHVRWLSMWLLGSIDITESWLKGQYTPEKVGMTSDNNPQTISARTVLSESDKNDSSVTSNSMCRHMLLAPFVHTTTNYKMETFSARLALCEGNAPVTGGFPSERTVTRNFDVFLYVPEQTAEQTIPTPVIWDAIALIMTSLQWPYKIKTLPVLFYWRQ